MRRNPGPGPFNLSLVEDRDRQKIHKRKRSNDDTRDEDNKRTKIDKQVGNNNNSSIKPATVETVDLATSEKGGVSHTSNTIEYIFILIL